MTTSYLTEEQPQLPYSILLVLVLALFAFLNFYNLEAIGDSNLYYTAGVESMLQSWHNFFFLAAEPGGSVTIDKPPLGLWLEATSAYFLGVSGFATVLPNMIAGFGSILLVYQMLYKRYGVWAALVATTVMATTPVVIATQRNNTMDGVLTFFLVLAVWFFWEATEHNKTSYLYAGVVIVGLAFNVKMLQAYLILPACYALYFWGADETLKQKINRLLKATVLLVVVSLSWAVVVDLVPENYRPYIGSTESNRVMELIVGHNGASRLLGPQQGRPNDGAISGPPPRASEGAPPAGGPGGMDEVGRPSPLRFFVAPLSKEISWLLPLALMGLLVLAVQPVRWPLRHDQQVIIVWGGWLVTCLVFFSVANFFHAYYLVMMAPPLGVLIGTGLTRMWQAWQKWGAWLLGMALVTLLYQLFNVVQLGGNERWAFLSLLVAIGGIFLLLRRGWEQVGVTAVLFSLFIIPLGWSFLTNQQVGHPGLPSAYQSQAEVGLPRDNQQVNEQLLNYLQLHTQEMTYLMAVPSSMQGAVYVLATSRPVLYMGGFGGGDAVVDEEDIAQLVMARELRYVMTGGERRSSAQLGIEQWAQANCTMIEMFSTVADNGDQRRERFASTMLYDCGVELGLKNGEAFVN